MYLSGKSHYIRSIVYQRGKVCKSRGSTLSSVAVVSLQRGFVLSAAVTPQQQKTYCTSSPKRHGSKTSRGFDVSEST
jgi:hypothetical protein